MLPNLGITINRKADRKSSDFSRSGRSTSTPLSLYLIVVQQVRRGPIRRARQRRRRPSPLVVVTFPAATRAAAELLDQLRWQIDADTGCGGELHRAIDHGQGEILQRLAQRGPVDLGRRALGTGEIGEYAIRCPVAMPSTCVDQFPGQTWMRRQHQPSRVALPTAWEPPSIGLEKREKATISFLIAVHHKRETRPVDAGHRRRESP